jgi:NTE family protein
MKKIGLVLGGGGARGCAHVGAIKALEEAEIPIHCIAGTSIGAIVGGIYSVGKLEELNTFLSNIKWNDVLTKFDPAVLDNGIFKGKKAEKLIEKLTDNKSFSDTIIPFVAIATDLGTGEEIQIKEGKLAKAIRASISLPGIFTVTQIDDKYLLDGGVVNPLPINVIRDMGMDIVIAIDLNKEFVEEKHKMKVLKEKSTSKLRSSKAPTIIDVMEETVFLMQSQITEKNLENHPADVLINMKLSSASLFDFHIAKTLIEEGYKQMKKRIPEIKKLISA